MTLRTTGILLLLAFLAACSADRKESVKTEPKPKRTQAPEVFEAKFETSKGDFVVEVTRAWAPRGADRFYELIGEGYFNQAPFYRVVRNFVVQWGIHRDPAITHLWSNLRILDDPVKQSNKRGTLAFAASGPASRTTQVFINLRNNAALDRSGFAPFGRVTSGLDVVEKLYVYGELAPRGGGPDFKRLETEGNRYLEREFPRMDTIRKATVIKE